MAITTDMPTRWVAIREFAIALLRTYVKQLQHSYDGYGGLWPRVALRRSDCLQTWG